jgi:type VI secretion system protein ImpE
MSLQAEQFLKSGQPGEALSALQDEVRARPQDPKLRVFLFQLLAVLGNWERALNQLQVAAGLDPAALPMAHAYREAIRGEKIRAAVFAGERSPTVFGDPDRWVALLLESLKLTAEGQAEKALALRDEAFDAAPTTTGSVDGNAFDWVADADPRLGPMTEALVNGDYFWIPFACLQEIRIEPPADLRDFVWLPADFVWANGGTSPGLIPVRYPGSEASDDPAIKLARKTDWHDIGDDIEVGLGQRMWATDNGEYPLLDVRCVTLNTGETTSSASEDG